MKKGIGNWGTGNKKPGFVKRAILKRKGKV